MLNTDNMTTLGCQEGMSGPSVRVLYEFYTSTIGTSTIAYVGFSHVGGFVSKPRIGTVQGFSHVGGFRICTSTSMR